MQNGLIALIGKTKLGEDLERLFCPSKIGIAKSLIGNLGFLKYRDSLLSLLLLLTFAQKPIIVVNISMDANFSTTTSYLCNQCGVSPQYYAWDEKCWR